MLLPREVELMEHALGIDQAFEKKGYHYKRHGILYVKSYRNYFQTRRNKDTYNRWLDLESQGLAEMWAENDYPYFAVTDEGIEQLQEQQKYVIRFIE